MVLVDFTVAERWRIFGELSFALVRRKEMPVASQRIAPATQVATKSTHGHVDPQESAARQHAQATLMQRML